MSQIHILDGQKDIILDYITAPNIISDDHKKSLEDTLETYDFITFANKRYSEHLEKRNRIIIPDEDDSLIEFVIFEAHKYKDTEGYKAQVYANASYLELKKASILYPDNGYTGSASQHAGRALNDTGWQVGIVEGKGTRTLTINNHTNPYEMLKRIAREFELELKFRIEHDGNKVTGRYVDLIERVGQWRGREVEFGKDLDGIRRVEKQDIVTALLGLSPEREDGTRIEVLVTDEDALQRWGRIDEHGNLKHLIEPYEIQSERSEMTEAEARQYTRTALNKRINTQITYETTIVDLEEVPGMENKKIRFGDTIKIKDTSFNPPLYLEARVFEQNRSIKSKAKKDIKLGDFIEYTEEEVNAIWEQLKKQIQNRVSFYEMAEYTYDKLTIDDKDETVFEDGKTFAEATGIQAEENAKAFAVEEDKKIKLDVEQYADNAAEEKANSALEQAKMYAVAKTVYENQMQQIASDIASRAPLEYVDGQLRVIEDELEDFNVTIEEKADKSTVYTIEEVDNRINNLVSVTQYETDQQGIMTQLESHGTRIGQNEHAIGLKADASHVDSVENELTRKIGNVEVTAEGASITASEVRADLDGLEIGGRNFALNSNELVKNESRFTYRLSEEISSYPVTKFTVSFDMKYTGEDDISRVEIYFYNGEFLSYAGGNSSGNRENTSIGGLKNEGKWHRYEGAIYTVDDISEHSNVDIVTRLRLSEGGFSSDAEIRNMKVEKGNKATDWSPAPEDTDEAINQVSGRVETLDGEITALAGEVSLKASQSVVDSLEGRVSTAEGELRVLPGQIELKVSKDGVIGAINATPEQLLIDFDKIKMTGELEAKHIKSLNGLNVNNQFVVDNNGNVSFKGNLTGASGTFSGDLQGSTIRGSLIVLSKALNEDENIGLTGTYNHVDSRYNREAVRYDGVVNLNSAYLSFRSKTTVAEGTPYQYNMFQIADYGANSVDIRRFRTSSNDSATGSFRGNEVGTRIDAEGLTMYLGGTSDTNTTWTPSTTVSAFGVAASEIWPFENLYTPPDGRIRSQDGAILRLTSDYIVSSRFYENTSTSTTNLLRVSSSGIVWRSTSSRRYKLLEEPISLERAKKFLNISAKTWYDKKFCDIYVDALNYHDKRELQEYYGKEKLRRIPGLIAEDLHDEGLCEYVEYDDQGRPDGISSFAWAPMLELIKDLYNELEELKNERSNV